MNFNYYDTLANLVLGYLLLFVIMYLFDVEYNESYAIPYMAIGFVAGYFLNAVSSLIEEFYFWTFGGVPSSRLLQHNEKKGYAGINKVRFYEARKAVDDLRIDCGNPKANEREMFSRAMREVGGETDSRIATFNAQYAFSRVMLTFVLISTILVIAEFRCDWRAYTIMLPILLVAWNRCRERGYYFSKEVLKEFLNSKKNNNQN